MITSSQLETYLIDIIKKQTNSNVNTDDYPRPRSRLEKYLQTIISNLDSDPGIDLSSYVQFTDVANEEQAGVVKISSTSGIEVESDGGICVKQATNNDIANRTETCKPIVPANLNDAVKAALTDTKRINDMSDTEKANARESMGAVGFNDYASTSKAGVVSIEKSAYSNSSGLKVSDKGVLGLDWITSNQIDSDDGMWQPIPYMLLGSAVKHVRDKSGYGINYAFYGAGEKIHISRGYVYFIRSSSALTLYSEDGTAMNDTDGNAYPTFSQCIMLTVNNILQGNVHQDIGFIPKTLGLSSLSFFTPKDTCPYMINDKDEVSVWMIKI